MSGVFARNKKETFFAPRDYAAELQDAVTAYVMNEKRIPKRWKYVIGLDLIRKTDEIMDLAIDANRIPTDETHAEKRRDKWDECLTACDQLDRKLKRAQKNIPTATAGSMKEILAWLDKEEKAIYSQKNFEKNSLPGDKAKK